MTEWRASWLPKEAVAHQQTVVGILNLAQATTALVTEDISPEQSVD
jgi:hypothetical protein